MTLVLRTTGHNAESVTTCPPAVPDVTRCGNSSTRPVGDLAGDVFADGCCPVLTAIAVNVERLSQQPSGEGASSRPPTAFQDYLDQQGIPRLRSWRAVS
jgi:hypothetical protein